MKKKILITIAIVIFAWVLYKTVPYVLLMIEEMNDPNYYYRGSFPPSENTPQK